MAPLPKKTIEHFTHPGHPLLEVYNNDKEYLCDGCKTSGIGTRYRCHGCDFDLHQYCGTCPMNLSSFMHTQHQLNLVLRKPQATRQNERICDVCGDHVEGLFYRCKLCEFDVHPVCTQLPQQLRHVLHPQHPLTLQPCSNSWCIICRNECSSWRYRCGICCVDIHLGCVLSPCNGSTSTTRSVPKPVPPPPSFGVHNVYGIPPGFSTSYNMYQHQQYGSNQHVGGGMFGKRMSELVGKLAFGVVTNMVFGGSDFSFFS